MCGKVRGESVEVLQLSDTLEWKSDYALFSHTRRNDSVSFYHWRKSIYEHFYTLYYY